MGDMIRGLDIEAEHEFCQRYYSMRGNLKMLESKKDMKIRTRKSPDDADAIVVVAELIRLIAKLGSTSRDEKTADQVWRDFQKKNNIYSPKDYLVSA